MQTITSKDNELIKHIRKLKDKKYRDESNEYVVEGVKLVEEAVKENAKIKQIIVCEDTTRTYEIPTHIMLEIAKYECISVSDKIFNIITQVTNPQGIMAIIEKNAQNAKIDYTQDIIVVLDDVQDPGNLGTIMRAAEAAGVTGILMSSDCVDIYNPKTIRSTMGALYRVPFVVSEDFAGDIERLKKAGVSTYAAHLGATISYEGADYKKPCAFMIGNEANGLSDEVAALADCKILIPMAGQVESLNAAMAATVLMFEAARQRRN